MTKLYSYATILVLTHGFSVRTNREHTSEALINEEGIELLVNMPPNHPYNVSVKPDELNKVVWDIRSKTGTNFVMVYEHGLPEEEILAIIKPQLVELMQMFRKNYETLIKNVDAMITAVHDNKFEYICERKK